MKDSPSCFTHILLAKSLHKDMQLLVPIIQHSIRKKEIPLHPTPWSNSSGMTNWIGRVILFTSGVRSTTLRIIPCRPSVSCSMTERFHVCRGWTSSWSSATSPLLNLVDTFCCWTSWKLFNVVSYTISHRLQSRLRISAETKFFCQAPVLFRLWSSCYCRLSLSCEEVSWC